MTGHGLSQGVQAREEDKDSVRERRPRDKMGLDEGDWGSGWNKDREDRGLGEAVSMTG